MGIRKQLIERKPRSQSQRPEEGELAPSPPAGRGRRGERPGRSLHPSALLGSSVGQGVPGGARKQQVGGGG